MGSNVNSNFMRDAEVTREEHGPANGHAAWDVGHPGERIGAEAFRHAELQSHEVCRRERQRIERINEPRIRELRARIASLEEEEQDLTERMRKAPPPGDQKTRRRKARGYAAVAASLVLGAIYFAAYTLAPYQLGILGWVLSLAIGIVTPFLVDHTVDVWERRDVARLKRTVTTLMCLAALAGVSVLAVVRGSILREQIKGDTPDIVFDEGGQEGTTKPQEGFYDRSAGLLELAMALISLAMEVGAGLAWVEARRWNATAGESVEELRPKRETVRTARAAAMKELTALENAGELFEQEYQRDYARAVLNRARDAALKTLSVLAVCAALLTPVHAAERLNLVVAVDLTASVTGRADIAGKTQLQQNVSTVTRLLGTVPAGARVTVVGITDRSFSEPYVLLSAELGTHEGFFKERIASARRQLQLAWQRRSKDLATQFQSTDLLGSLVIASQLFETRPGWRHVLVILSDMRHEERGLNFARPSTVDTKALIQRVEREGLLAALPKVDVYVLGVHAAGKRVSYWNSLREFWQAYFTQAGATLRRYSMLRDLPDFSQ